MTTTEPRHHRGVALELPTNQWVPINKVYPVFDGPFPSHLMFNDERIRVAVSWREVYGQVVAWLIADDLLGTTLHVDKNPHRCIVNTVPFHDAEEKDRFSQAYELPNGWWLEVGGPEPLQFERTLELLKRLNVSTERVKVMLEHRDDSHWN